MSTRARENLLGWVVIILSGCGIYWLATTLLDLVW